MFLVFMLGRRVLFLIREIDFAYDRIIVSDGVGEVVDSGRGGEIIGTDYTDLHRWGANVVSDWGGGF